MERGRRVVEVLKQPQFSPMPVEEQVIVIYAVTEGHMDDIEIGDIKRFEAGLRDHFRSRQPGLLSDLRDTGQLPEVETLDAAIAEHKETFEGSGTEE